MPLKRQGTGGKELKQGRLFLRVPDSRKSSKPFPVYANSTVEDIISVFDPSESQSIGLSRNGDGVLLDSDATLAELGLTGASPCGSEIRPRLDFECELYLDPWTAGCPVPDPLRVIFDQLDGDGNGLISFSEYTRGMSGRHSHVYRRIMDVNGVGWHSLRGVLHQVDTNQDELISYEEFSAAAHNLLGGCQAEHDSGVVRHQESDSADSAPPPPPSDVGRVMTFQFNTHTNQDHDLAAAMAASMESLSVEQAALVAYQKAAAAEAKLEAERIICERNSSLASRRIAREKLEREAKVKQLDQELMRHVRWADKAGGILCEFEPAAPESGFDFEEAFIDAAPDTRRLAIMRHSVRVDADPSATWDDKRERPYDTPISDFALPAQQAGQMIEKGVHEYDLILCSPFRRCLQTAAIVARTLGINTVRVDKGLGELNAKVRQAQRLEQNGPVDGVVEYLSELEQSSILQSFSGATIQQVEQASMQQVPAADEDMEGGKRRFENEMRRVRDRVCFEEGLRVLVIAHGDTVDGAVQAFTDQFCYQTDECCWMVFDFDDEKQASVIESSAGKIATMPKDQ